MATARPRDTAPAALHALRRERHGFVGLAVLLLVFQALLPLAQARAAPAAFVLSLCTGFSADETGGASGALHMACVCGPACPHAGCGACAPAISAAWPTPGSLDAARRAGKIDAPKPPARLRPASRDPPTVLHA